MANKKLFKSVIRESQKTDTINNAGGTAYSMSAKQELAQYAATGVFGNTYYSNGKSDLDRVLELAKKTDPEFLAKLAIYSRKNNQMKDVPAFLLAVLSTKNTQLFKYTFPIVIDNGKMLRNFVQIIRSGVVGRKSFGSSLKKAINSWLLNRTHEQLFHDSIGNDPSLADIIRMTHPCPPDTRYNALFAYICGRKYNKRSLPACVKEYEAFKEGTPGKRDIPKVEFRLLTGAGIVDEEWKSIAKDAKWQMTFMNLNTFERHGVFNDSSMVDIISNRLSDVDNVKKSRCFPYQILNAHNNITHTMPRKIKTSLADAMEIAIENVPDFSGKKVFVGVDCSGSMSSPVISNSKTPSQVKCSDVAGLFAAAVFRRNHDVDVLTFSSSASRVKLSQSQTVFQVANELSKAGGGTNISSVLQKLNQEHAKGDVVIMVSDNESWMDDNPRSYWYAGTAMKAEWDKFKARNPKAKLVCIDITPNKTTQVKDNTDILNVGGFSDNVFQVIADFLETGGKPNYWVKKIESEIKVDIN